jgi:GxxExxY protein
MTTSIRDGDLPHRALTDRVLNAFYAVANELGHGFTEIIYRRAMAVVLREAGLQAEEVPALRVHFHGRVIGSFYPDILVEDTILLEIKALREVDGRAEAQLLNYLKAAGGGVGLLLNFGRRAEFKRRVVGDPLNSLPLLRRVPDSEHEAPNTPE